VKPVVDFLEEKQRNDELALYGKRRFERRIFKTTFNFI
jgi:hypothetical protein